MDYKQQAEEKLDLETQAKLGGGKIAEALRPEILKQLKCFVRQNDEFAEAVVCSGDKTLNGCCDFVAKGVSKFISDIDVYRKAVDYYFPGADVDFSMTINLCGSHASESNEPKTIKLSLEEFFDF